MKKNHWIAASALACMLAFAPSTMEAKDKVDNKRPPVEERNFTSKAVEKLIKVILMPCGCVTHRRSCGRTWS